MMNYDLYGTYGRPGGAHEGILAQAGRDFRPEDIERCLAHRRALRSRSIWASFRGLFRGLGRALKALAVTAIVRYRRGRAKAVLGGLSDRVLSDIGLRREQIALRVEDTVTRTEAEQWLSDLWVKIADRLSGRWARRSLAYLDNRTLEDIGLNRLEVAAALAASKPAKRSNYNQSWHRAA